MAIRTSWAVGSDTERILNAVDSRTAIGALWTPGADAVKARGGFRPGPGSVPGIVTATGSPDQNVHIAPFVYLLNSSRQAGPYELILDAPLTFNMLASHPADPSNPRKDLIIAQQNDAAAGDADSLLRIVQVVGTPSGSPAIPTVTGSPDYAILATVTVPALSTTVTTPNIANPTATFVVAVGGTLPVASAAERNALTAYESMRIYRLDTNWEETYDGAAWRVNGTAIVSNAAGLALITNPLTGQLAIQQDIMQIRQWSGAAWTSVGGGIGDTTTAFRTATLAIATGAGTTYCTTASLPAGTYHFEAAIGINNTSANSITAELDFSGTASCTYSEALYNAAGGATFASTQGVTAFASPTGTSSVMHGYWVYDGIMVVTVAGVLSLKGIATTSAKTADGGGYITAVRWA